MGGGLNGKMNASRIPARPPKARPARAFGDYEVIVNTAGVPEGVKLIER